MERSHGCCRLVSWGPGRRLERLRGRLVVLQQERARPVGRESPQRRFSSRKSGCRSRALHLRYGPRRSGLRRLHDVAASLAGLTQQSQSDSNERGAGRHHGPAPLGVFHGQPQSALTILRIRPPLTPTDREYTPARSADRHRPEAHWRNPSILSPAVTATGTTFWAA